VSRLARARRVAAAFDGDRMLRRLAELAEIGADPAGGVTRIAFTDAEAEANELVIGWMQELGLTVAKDSFGNLFGSTDGNSPGASPWLAGSHLDTVPNGGRLDGALGVVAAVEAIDAMRRSVGPPTWPLEVAIWRSEEPVTFAQGKAGSLVFSGTLRQEELVPLDGVANEPRRPPTTLDLPTRPLTRRVGGCLELHIEQGRRLESSGHRIGVVTAVAAPIRMRVELVGRADHSGATPMQERRDAMCTAAEVTLAVEKAALAESQHGTVATTVQVAVTPGAMNVIPGAAELLIDVRGIDSGSMQRAVSQIVQDAFRVGEDRNVGVSIETLSRADPTPFDTTVVARLSETATGLGHDPLLIPSGAGHDAQCIARLAPSGMLFVPSVDGVSHSPMEHTHEADLVAGAQVLAAAWATIGP
jgi:hydantoinase/carbamoylase family amidase